MKPTKYARKEVNRLRFRARLIFAGRQTTTW